MKKLKIFRLSFSFAFISTAAICILFGHPFIFGPIAYGFKDFFLLGLLLGFLVFCLVFINFPLLNWIKFQFFNNSNDFVFYVIASIFILQLENLMAGYLESLLTRGVEADSLYYYKGVSNSWIYILTGNLTAFITCKLYVKSLA
jgi:hypothetical protein